MVKLKYYQEVCRRGQKKIEFFTKNLAVFLGCGKKGGARSGENKQLTFSSERARAEERERRKREGRERERERERTEEWNLLLLLLLGIDFYVPE